MLEFRFPSANGKSCVTKKTSSCEKSVSDTGNTNQPVRELVVDEVLYFMFNKCDNIPMSTLKSVIYKFYREDEIVAAKQNVVQYIGEVMGKAIEYLAV